jgi:SAM-dependent methyltransferase
VSKEVDLVAAAKMARRNTEHYALQPGFRDEWLGISGRSRDYLAQQLRTFGELLEPVTTSLAGWRVLDVGCGDGRWLRRMVEFDARPEDVVGVDVSDVRFEIGRLKNPLVRMIKTDGASIPFPNGSFELVTEFVCFSQIPAIELRRQVALEMQRVAAPGAYIYWWDQDHMEVPNDRRSRLDPTDYFDWPVRSMRVGRHPEPGAGLRSFRGQRLLINILRALAAQPTHVAALIGPKPG